MATTSNTEATTGSEATGTRTEGATGAGAATAPDEKITKKASGEAQKTYGKQEVRALTAPKQEKRSLSEAEIAAIEDNRARAANPNAVVYRTVSSDDDN